LNKMKKLIFALTCAMALSGCVTATAPQAATSADVAAEAATPAAVKFVDPNPYADYAAGMRSVEGAPMAVEWQRANAAEIEAATDPDAIRLILADDGAINALLSEVNDAYATDPFVATRIASASQFVMKPGGANAAARGRWRTALLRSARSSGDAYRTMYFLEQLRWCGDKSDAVEIAKIGAESNSKAVADFAAMVCREIKGP